MPEKLLTIGVYGFTEQQFFQALLDANVDLFCDVRARRGLRGSEYAFANAQRLQAQLVERGIRYVHIKDLAPPPEVRDSQKSEDLRTGTAKRGRDELGEVFKAKYRETCLAGLDASALPRHGGFRHHAGADGDQLLAHPALTQRRFEPAKGCPGF